MKKWYSVQHGDNFDLDNGSFNRRTAGSMAAKIKRDERYNGEEIRIVTVINDFCENEEIIRQGTR